MPHAPLVGPSLRLRLFGIPIWFHWSFPGVGLGISIPAGAVALFATGSLALDLFAWCMAAVSALVLLHEGAHAVVARSLSIEVHGLLFAAAGGCCLTEGAASTKHELAYSLAGLVCQFAVLVATTLVLVGVLPSIELRFGAAVFTVVNVLLIVANSWPSPGSDGHRVVQAIKRLLAQGQESAA
jgi:Zn-dependent protease